MNKSTIGWVLNIMIGIYSLAHGILNMLRGNDFYFGVMLVLLSVVFFLPARQWFKKLTGINIHYVFQILLALFIVWVTLAVGAVNEGYYPEITG